MLWSLGVCLCTLCYGRDDGIVCWDGMRLIRGLGFLWVYMVRSFLRERETKIGSFLLSGSHK